MNRTAKLAGAAVVAAALLLAPAAASAQTGLASPAAVSAVVAGLPVATTTVTVSENGRRFSARLVRPTAPGVYPVIGFGHGFTQSASRYQSTLAALASSGYIVIAPNTQTGLLPSHSSFADDLTAAITWAQRTLPNADRALDAVAGHSMGGGAAVLAASRAPGIDAVATLAAADTRPSAVAAAPGIAAPSLFVVGSSDTVVRPASTRSIFAAAPSPSAFVSITGGYHCGFLDSSSFFGLGCDRGAIPRGAQLALSNGLLVRWLDATLKGGPALAFPPGTTGETK